MIDLGNVKFRIHIGDTYTETYKENPDYVTLSSLNFKQEDILLLSINSAASYELADAFKEISQADIIGLDSEWVKKSATIRTAIFQIATPKRCFVFDFKKSASKDKYYRKNRTNFESNFKLLLKEVLLNEKILKVAWDFDLDLKNLNNRFDDSFPEITNFVDLMRNYPKEYEKGFSNCCGIYLGKKLDKTLQTCDWEKRPLTKDKLVYAAIDAIASISVYYRMKNKEINFIPNTLTLDQVNMRMLEYRLNKLKLR